MAEYCNDGRYKVYTTNWVSQNQYRAVAGKIIGRSAQGTTVDWADFKNKYGGQCIVCDVGIVSDLVSMGYDVANLMVSIAVLQSYWNNPIDQAIGLGVRQFYIDEPIQNYSKQRGIWNPDCGCSGLKCGLGQGIPNWSDMAWLNLKTWMNQVAAYINNLGVGATLWTSESHFDPSANCTMEYFANLILETNPHPFAGCHTHFVDYTWPIPDIDPRQQWDYLRSRLGSLFNFAWIKTRNSPEEMGLLFGHANNLGGINKILYWVSSNIDNDRIDLASEQGQARGWLQRLQKQVRNTFCCTTPQYDPEFCELMGWEYTGEERWV